MLPIRVGLVGCGEIAQIMHLPFLSQLPQFEIAALCDLSPTMLDAMGDRYGVAARYTDYQDLVATPELDVVAILTMDHYPAARAAIAAGKHVFVEKPLAFSREEARELVTADYGQVVLVPAGMPHRFENSGAGVPKLTAVHVAPKVAIEWLDEPPAGTCEVSHPAMPSAGLNQGHRRQYVSKR
jgi:predicted dehydrogenase